MTALWHIRLGKSPTGGDDSAQQKAQPHGPWLDDAGGRLSWLIKLGRYVMTQGP